MPISQAQPPNLWSGAGEEPTYHWVRDNPGWAETKQILNSKWEEYWALCPDRLKKFVDGFSKNIQGQSFQMILTLLLQRGHGTVQAGTRTKGPDILLTSGGRTIAIECVTPRLGETIDSVEPNPPGVLITGDDQANPISLRYFNSLSEKAKEFKKWQEQEVIGRDGIAIIAMCGGIVHAGSRTPTVEILGKICSPVESGMDFNKPRMFLKKKNGASFPADVFTDRSFSHIHGIIFYPFPPFYMTDGGHREVFLFLRDETLRLPISNKMLRLPAKAFK